VSRRVKWLFTEHFVSTSAGTKKKKQGVPNQNASGRIGQGKRTRVLRKTEVELNGHLEKLLPGGTELVS